MSAATVSRVALAVTGRDLRLHESILSQNSSPTGDNIAETFEAVLGAIYLDSGSMLSTVKEVIKRIGLDKHPYLRAHKQPQEGVSAEQASRVVEQQTRKRGSLKGTAITVLKDQVTPNKSQVHNVVVPKIKLNLAEPETVVETSRQNADPTSAVTSNLTKGGTEESKQPQGIVKGEARSLRNVLTNLYDNVSKLVDPMLDVRRSQSILGKAPTTVFISHVSSTTVKPEVKGFSGDISRGVRTQARYAAMVLTKFKYTQLKKDGIKSDLETISNNTLLAVRKKHSENNVKVHEEAVTAQTDADDATPGRKLVEKKAQTKADEEKIVRIKKAGKEIKPIVQISQPQPQRSGGEAQYDKMLVSGKATKSRVNAGNIATPALSAQKGSSALAKRSTSAPAPPPHTTKPTSIHTPAPSGKSQKATNTVAHLVRPSVEKKTSNTSDTTSGNYDTTRSKSLSGLERDLLQSHRSAWSSSKSGKQQRPQIADVLAAKAGLPAVEVKSVGRTVMDSQVRGELQQPAVEAQIDTYFPESEVDLLMGGILREQDQAAYEFAESSTPKLETNADSVDHFVKGSERSDALAETQPHKLKPSSVIVDERKKLQSKEMQLTSQQQKWARTASYIQEQIRSRLNAGMIPAHSAEVTTIGDNVDSAGTGAAEPSESFRTWRQRQQHRVSGNDMKHEAVRTNVEVLRSTPMELQHSSTTLSAITEQKSLQDGEYIDSTTEADPKNLPFHVQQSAPEHEGIRGLKFHMSADAVKSKFGLCLRPKESEQEKEEISSARANESNNTSDSVDFALPTDDQLQLGVHKFKSSKQVPLETPGEEEITAASHEWDPTEAIRASLASRSTLVVLPPSDALLLNQPVLSASPKAAQVARTLKVLHADRSENRPSGPT
jgi:hypothetical protein